MYQYIVPSLFSLQRMTTEPFMPLRCAFIPGIAHRALPNTFQGGTVLDADTRSMCIAD